MKAVYASTVNHADPLAALAVGEQPEPRGPPVLVDRFGARGSRKPITTSGRYRVWVSPPNRRR